VSGFTVSCPDGRAIAGRIAGAPDGRTLVFHDGTPSAAVSFPQLDEAAAAFDLRVVSWSRPGYAESGPQPGRTVADVVDDARTVFSDLGVDDYVVLGWSGGGPHALAHAAIDGAHCRAAATMGGVAPYDGTGLDWIAGAGPENLEEFGAALDGRERLHEFLVAVADGLSAVTPEGVVEGLGELVGPVDVEAVRGPMAEHLAEGMRAAVSGGIDGWRDDDLAFVAPWGFELSDIAVPVTVWQGELDLMIPSSHGRRLVAAIPAATARFEAGDGHLSFVDRLDEVLRELVSAADW
jgi:pimeloyl-ACP methyl ester carboxylesterase